MTYLYHYTEYGEQAEWWGGGVGGPGKGGQLYSGKVIRLLLSVIISGLLKGVCDPIQGRNQTMLYMVSSTWQDRAIPVKVGEGGGRGYLWDYLWLFQPDKNWGLMGWYRLGEVIIPWLLQLDKRGWSCSREVILLSEMELFLQWCNMWLCVSSSAGAVQLRKHSEPTLPGDKALGW